MFFITFVSFVVITQSVIYCDPLKPIKVDCEAKCPVDIETVNDAVSFRYKSNLYTCAQCSTDCPIDISVTKECGVAFKYHHDNTHQDKCECDEGWSLGPDMQCIKYMGDFQYTNFGARRECADKHQARIVSIKNAEKQTFVQGYVTEQSIGYNIWLDAMRVHSENEDTSFVWSDGSTLDSYVNWKDSDGLTRYDGQYCVFMASSRSSDSSKWLVYDCTKSTTVNFKLNAVCERPCTYR